MKPLLNRLTEKRVIELVPDVGTLEVLLTVKTPLHPWSSRARPLIGMKPNLPFRLDWVTKLVFTPSGIAISRLNGILCLLREMTRRGLVLICLTTKLGLMAIPCLLSTRFST